MRVTIFFLAFFICSHLYARHIIGGDITYACLGSGEYEFTMNVYRDCNTTGALFDSSPGGFPATVTIFHNASTLTTLVLEAPVISSINQTGSAHPCPENLNLCLEKGTYKFTAELPESNGEYTISYQRCCRVPTIDNIFVPESTGLTLTIDVGEQAQETCNNSPVFTNDFDNIICANEPFTMDLSATDEDGDFLLYFFTTPFLGGGPEGTGTNGGSPTDINGVAPDPESPPPYASVNFVEPTFTSQFPLRGDPRVTIDPATGIIHGTPMILGQFVLTVAVEDFRNGKVVSRVQRDIQINVADCNESLCNTTSTFNKNNSEKQLSFQPNPSTGIFSIAHKDFNIESYKVYNVYGKLLIQDQDNLDHIDISNYSNGIYIVQVLSTNGELISGKVVKH